MAVSCQFSVKDLPDLLLSDDGRSCENSPVELAFARLENNDLSSTLPTENWHWQLTTSPLPLPLTTDTGN
jgi:hypothetical protein